MDHQPGYCIRLHAWAIVMYVTIVQMYGLYKDPNGENIFITKSAINSGTMKSQLGNPEAIVCSCKVNATSPWNNIDPSGCNFASIEVIMSCV